jgi:AraC-like DNA-binding protein/mannose-6-phosphate isomerase-like protein (cupin superfamily)
MVLTMLKTHAHLTRMNRLRSADAVTFGDVIYPPGGAFGPRTQADFQLFVVLDGEAKVSVDALSVHVPMGRALMLSPKHTEHFEFAATRSTRHTWCAVHPDLVSDSLRSSLEAAKEPIVCSNRIADLMQYGLDLPESDLPEASALLHSLGIATLHGFVFDLEYVRRTGAEPEALRRARLYVDTHLETALTLGDLARVGNVSAQHLTRLFKRYQGVTPMRYLWERRVARGVRLLLETGLSVAAISERVGFESPFHFSRLVRVTQGASPRALRDGRRGKGGRS